MPAIISAIGAANIETRASDMGIVVEPHPSPMDWCVNPASAPNMIALTGASRRQSLASSVRAANLRVPAPILAEFGLEAR